MSQVVFIYNGQNIIIQNNYYDIMYNIFQKFSTKANINLNSVYFLYNGKTISNQYLKLEQIINIDDKMRNKMNILVVDNQNTYSFNSNINSMYKNYNESNQIAALDTNNMNMQQYNSGNKGYNQILKSLNDYNKRIENGKRNKIRNSKTKIKN